MTHDATWYEDQIKQLVVRALTAESQARDLREQWLKANRTIAQLHTERHRLKAQDCDDRLLEEHRGANEDWRPLRLESRPMDRPNGIDVQATLDEWLDGNPEAQKYISQIYYVPDDAEIPRDVTHMNRLTSAEHPDLELRLGVVATAETAAIVNVILGLIERAAPDPKERE